MKTYQIKEDEPKYTEPVSFPCLPEINTGECESILEGFSHGKALAFDGINDVLFAKELRSQTAEVLKDIWNGKWENHIGQNKHFTSRLIPLNKIYPNVPTREKFRPIMSQAP